MIFNSKKNYQLNFAKSSKLFSIICNNTPKNNYEKELLLRSLSGFFFRDFVGREVEIFGFFRKKLLNELNSRHRFYRISDMQW